MVRVFVKWGKERFEVDANVEDSPLQLKSQLFSLTGVNPDRQKVLIKVSQIFSLLSIGWSSLNHFISLECLRILYKSCLNYSLSLSIMHY